MKIYLLWEGVSHAFKKTIINCFLAYAIFYDVSCETLVSFIDYFKDLRLFC